MLACATDQSLCSHLKQLTAQVQPMESSQPLPQTSITLQATPATATAARTYLPLHADAVVAVLVLLLQL